jgi:histidinol-phosphate/aromatic aminotransferase/cobyric acid decarboxylase-like protein
MPDADRYLRIASRTEKENQELVARLTELLRPRGMD